VHGQVAGGEVAEFSLAQRDVGRAVAELRPQEAEEPGRREELDAADLVAPDGMRQPGGDLAGEALLLFFGPMTL
jgi:hypothetical protein